MIWFLLGAALAAGAPADLKAAVLAYDQAQIHGDGPELSRLLADDYVLVNSRGVRETKAELIADYTAPGFTLEPFKVEQPIERVWIDGAVEGGVATLRGVEGGKRYEARLRFADIWAKRAGKWQVIFTHVASVPKPCNAGG